MQYNNFMAIKTILDTDIETFENAELSAVVKHIQDQARIATANIGREKNSFPLRPSSSLKSKRDLFYGLVNYYSPGTIPTSDIEGRACMLLELGHSIEKHLVDNIKRAYKIPYTAQKITYGEIKKKDGTKIVLGGELDFVIELADGEKIICDSKSSGDFAFKLALPKEEHVAQINLYLHSAWAREQNINRAWIFYYNKNTSDLRLCEFFYDAALARVVIARFQSVMDAYESGSVPAREHILGVDWQATYSSFREHEWKDYRTTYDKRVLSGDVAADVPDENFPHDKKALLRYLVTKFGTKVVTTVSGRTVYAIANADCSKLVLRDEGSDGFSS